jgi:hypothetical protein
MPGRMPWCCRKAGTASVQAHLPFSMPGAMASVPRRLSVLQGQRRSTVESVLARRHGFSERTLRVAVFFGCTSSMSVRYNITVNIFVDESSE